MTLLLWILACEAGKDSSPRVLPSDSGTDSATTTTTGLPSVQSVLSRLKQDPEGTLAEVAGDQGWPLPTQEGWLFVTTDRSWKVVGGDFDQWTGEKLTKESSFSWALAEVSAGDGYKFGDGQNWGADPWSRAYTYDSYGEISLIRPKVAHLERWPQVSGAGLAARELRVWVPEEAVTHVLYAHDGQNLFDPSAIWGGWRLQESLPPGMLVVGIDNTPDRMDEYTHTKDDIGEIVGGKAEDYGDLVENTIRPLIRDHYGEAGRVGMMGSSLGGLISLYFAHRYPEDYDFAASLSGTVGWGSIGMNNPTIIEWMEADGHGPVPLYIDSGGGGTCVDSDGDGIQDDATDGADNYCENLQLRDTLMGVGYQPEQDLWHWWEPGAEHNEMAWAARVFRPLELFAAR